MNDPYSDSNGSLGLLNESREAMPHLPPPKTPFAELCQQHIQYAPTPINTLHPGAEQAALYTAADTMNCTHTHTHAHTDKHTHTRTETILLMMPTIPGHQSDQNSA